jgi:hypothetical protein
MGLTLQFYAGHASSILGSVREVDLDFLERFDAGHTCADFSLHITPRDLDLLTAEVCKSRGTQATSLRENLDFDGEHVDEDDRGAYLVARPWVELWASIETETIDVLAASWFSTMQREYDDLEIRMTEEAKQAISDLLGTCRTAVDHGFDLVHVWFG